MNTNFNHDEYTANEGVFNERVFDPTFFPDEDWAVCGTELESTVSAEERVVSPGTEKTNWIINELEPPEQNPFDGFIDRLQVMHGAQILGTLYHRKNAVRAFGIVARYRNHSGEKLEDIAPYPRAATSRHALNAERLLRPYASELERINAASILHFLGGEDVPVAEIEERVRQLRTDCDDVFRLLLDVATSRAGEFDPMVEMLNKKSPYRAEILQGRNCSKRAINRIAKLFEYIGEIPPKR